MDDGMGGGFVSILPNSLVTVLKVTVTNTQNGIKKGLSYRFKYRASNINGFGEYSIITSILAASVPSAPQ